MSYFNNAIPVSVDVPFNASDYGATGSMTWTVDPGDVATYQYAIMGKLLFIWVRILTSTIGGTVAGQGLTIKLPNGILAARTFKEWASVSVNGGTTENGSYQPLAGSNLIDIRRLAGDFVASVDNNAIQLSGVIAIQ